MEPPAERQIRRVAGIRRSIASAGLSIAQRPVLDDGEGIVHVRDAIGGHVGGVEVGRPLDEVRDDAHRRLRCRLGRASSRRAQEQDKRGERDHPDGEKTMHIYNPR